MWKAVLNDGSEVSEITAQWPDIKDRIASLSMLWQGAEYSLPSGQKEYEHFKSGSCSIGGGPVTIESRTVGCRLDNGTMVRLRFKEDGSSVSVETEG